MLFENMRTSNGYDFKNLMELYYISKKLKFVDASVLEEHILSKVSVNQTVMQQASSSRIWQKKYIEQEFLSRLITVVPTQTSNSGSLFGATISTKYMIASLAFDWLGEKCCKSIEDSEALKASEEFKSFSQFLQDHSLLSNNLHDYIQLAARYPIAIESIGVLKIFQASGLIN